MKDESNNGANTATPVNGGIGISQKVLAKIKIPRKFEIFIEEYDEEGFPDGQGIWKPVKVDARLGGNGSNPVITVNSQEELKERQNFYSMAGQRFRILREIDPPDRNTILRLAVEQGIEIPNEVTSVPTVQISSNNVQSVVEEQKSINAPSHIVSGVTQSQKHEIIQQSITKTCDMQIKHDQQEVVRSKPKIVTIGDMQIKYDGDKVYQKQWIRLNSAETANFRIVNDSTNKIVPLAGKHIEAKKWVIVEEDITECTEITEEITND